MRMLLRAVSISLLLLTCHGRHDSLDQVTGTRQAECFFLWSSSVGGGFLPKAKIILWLLLVFWLCLYKKCITIIWFSNYRSVVQCMCSVFLTRESKCSVLEFWNKTPVKENCILMTWNQRFIRISFFLFCGLKTKVLFSIFQHFLIQTEPKQTKRSQNWRVADSCQNKRF